MHALQTRLLSLGIVAAVIVLAPPMMAAPRAQQEDRRSWYSAYDDGRRQIERREWNAAISSLQQAKRTGPRPGRHVRYYGDRFGDYVPDYYLGIAYLNLHRLDEANEAFDSVLRSGLVKPGDEEYAGLLAFMRSARPPTPPDTPIPNSPPPTSAPGAPPSAPPSIPESPPPPSVPTAPPRAPPSIPNRPAPPTAGGVPMQPTVPRPPASTTPVPSGPAPAAIAPDTGESPANVMPASPSTAPPADPFVDVRRFVGSLRLANATFIVPTTMLVESRYEVRLEVCNWRRTRRNARWIHGHDRSRKDRSGDARPSLGQQLQD